MSAPASPPADRPALRLSPCPPCSSLPLPCLLAPWVRSGGAGLGRNDRQQEVGPAATAEMERVAAAEDRGWAIVRIIMDEGTAAAHRVFHVGEMGRRAVIFVVLAAHGE